MDNNADNDLFGKFTDADVYGNAPADVDIDVYADSDLYGNRYGNRDGNTGLRNCDQLHRPSCCDT